MSTVVSGHPTTPAGHVSYQSLLCPIDFSAPSAVALRYAIALAHRWNGQVTVLHAVDPMLATAAPMAVGGSAFVDRTRSEVAAFAQETMQPGAPVPAIAHMVQVGRASSTILRTAQQCHADLIVMATYGMTGVRRMVLGSTARAVLRRTTLPVLAVPCDHTPPRIVAADWPGKRIVAALALDRRSDAAARKAAGIAASFGAALLLAHVVEAPPPQGAGGASAHERIRIGKAEAALAAIATDLAVLYPDVEQRVLCGNPPDELAALVLAERAGLLITFLETGARVFKLRRGSVSYHILTHATAPVLALPRP